MGNEYERNPIIFFISLGIALLIMVGIFQGISVFIIDPMYIDAGEFCEINGFEGAITIKMNYHCYNGDILDDRLVVNKGDFWNINYGFIERELKDK